MPALKGLMVSPVLRKGHRLDLPSRPIGACRPLSHPSAWMALTGIALLGASEFGPAASSALSPTARKALLQSAVLDRSPVSAVELKLPANEG